MSLPVLCLDFDGVIHSYVSGWCGAHRIPDPPVEGALDFLVEALDHFDVAILSSRSHQWGGRRAMKAWLIRELMEWRGRRALRIEEEYPELPAADLVEEYDRWARETVGRIAFPRYKPPAKVTIDDRAITFTGQWPQVESLKNFRPWNKRA